MKPTKCITDPEFKYVPAAETDLRKTFARARRELKKQQEIEAEAAKKVLPLKRDAKG